MEPNAADIERGMSRPIPGPGHAQVEETLAESRSAVPLWMEERRESELVQAVQRGEREAYRELIRHYERPVYRLSYALTRSHDEATALAVETFARGLAEITRIPEGKRFFPWLLRFARNLSVTRARRRADAEAKSLGGVDAGGKKTPHAGPERPVELEQRLLDALSELRPDEQMALALRVGERLSYAEIALLLDHSAGVTLSRLSSARALLLTRTRDGIGDLS
jgi:RNA polymerase sigma-70 factor, ECF subfamily